MSVTIEKTSVLIFLTESPMSKISFVVWSQVMNHGFFNMDPETKSQSKEWHTASSPRPKKAWMSKSKIKPTLICFFRQKGNHPHRIYSSWKNCQQSFFYKEKRVIRVRPDIADKMDAPSWQCPMSHCPLHRRIFDPKRHYCGSPAPLLTWVQPLWLFHFPKLKNVLKGRHFGTLENFQKSVTDMLKTIPVEDFQRCYQKWEQRLHRCVAAQENYFEEDNIDIWKQKLW